LKYSSLEIRQQFIDFFEKKDHKFIRSSSVVPLDDPTLLFTNAGMNQFKPYFLGLQKPKNLRVVNSQKCIRVSGKHNDLEEVGVDDYHHTFFEMLGNWSFGDYYKEEAIKWAWELLTDVWNLDKNRLWVTIFQEDGESGEIWKKNTDINPDRILKYGHKDNFWEMGSTGPCGPCTEIHYYTGKNLDEQISAGVNSLPEYREIWNLVFIQFNRDGNGVLTDLPQKHVDTGMGFERITAILNNKSSNYDTDLFFEIIGEIIKLTGKKYDFNDGVPHRVIADHIRMLVFSIADGAMPSNDGRGYVLRRVLRRAARFGRILEMHKPFIYKLVDSVCQIMGNTYTEIRDKQKHIQKVIKSEELAFNETLDRGLEVYEKITRDLSEGDIIPGKKAFKLYDTYGFPLDLTELMARDDKLTIEIEEFNNCMDEQKQRAKSSNEFSMNSENIDWKLLNDDSFTEFLGYDDNEASSKVIKYYKNNDHMGLVLDKTPFYAESGGQIADSGYLISKNINFRVDDVQKIGDHFIHIGQLEKGEIDSLGKIDAKINIKRRDSIKRNHTATHLLHQALKDVLGEHVEQAGSMVGDKFLRFDLTHYEQISDAQITEIEGLVNKIILDNIKVDTEIKSFKDAQEDGAMSLFGEKYGEIVRVVSVLGFSKELCGGTHVDRTGDIGFFKIISETALASGIRRLVAKTGMATYDFTTKQNDLIKNIKNKLKCSESDIINRLDVLLDDKKKLEKENARLNQEGNLIEIDNIMDSIEEINQYKLIVHKVDFTGDLLNLGDIFRKKIKKCGIVLIGTIQNSKAMLMCSVTDDLLDKIKAGDIVRKLGVIIGGGGGGKPHVAMAGGSEVLKIDYALEHGREIIKKILED